MSCSVIFEICFYKFTNVCRIITWTHQHHYCLFSLNIVPNLACCVLQLLKYFIIPANSNVFVIWDISWHMNSSLGKDYSWIKSEMKFLTSCIYTLQFVFVTSKLSQNDLRCGMYISDTKSKFTNSSDTTSYYRTNVTFELNSLDILNPTCRMKN